jgi:Protein of unknown function (DUF2924)
MQEILIDFEVFKALTAKRIDECHTYNDVIRDLLGLDSLLEKPDPVEALLGVGGDCGPVLNPLIPAGSLLERATGFSARGILLPNGTMLRAVYKQQQYTATIERGKWLDVNGKAYPSPSAAAKAVTGSNVNGLRFWHVKRPNDLEWRRLDLLQ